MRRAFRWAFGSDKLCQNIIVDLLRHFGFSSLFAAWRWCPVVTTRTPFGHHVCVSSPEASDTRNQRYHIPTMSHQQQVKTLTRTHVSNRQSHRPHGAFTVAQIPGTLHTAACLVEFLFRSIALLALNRILSCMRQAPANFLMPARPFERCRRHTVFGSVRLWVSAWVCAYRKPCEHRVSKTNEGSFTQFWSHGYLVRRAD